MTKDTEWTPQLDARLRELHTTELSFLQIAAALNAEFDLSITRNACIGRANRIKLGTRSGKPRRKQQVTPKARPYRRKKIVAPPIVPEPPAVVIGRLTMLQLNRTTCHWPSGDRPPYTYCGKPVHAGRPFCLDHCRAAYQAPEKTWI